MLIAGAGRADAGAIVSAVRQRLADAGVVFPVTLEVVEELPASSAGKRPMVVALRPAQA